ncbi:hypothetical protein Tsubulata_014483 [Turnera subulata]|uniref:Uncharacterized protein n=1 Tax=Turnera subulata TaxID=218843 RepID=A0A9Q0GJW1_9ROSI|nr:hypothetical protein Tsubulata_014483 [Turnera subulata]
MVSDIALLEVNASAETEKLEELLSLEHLDEIAIHLTSSTAVQKLLGSPELLEKITELVLTDRSTHFASAASPISEFPTATMRRVEKLDFWNCPSLRKVELGASLHLLHVRIWKCDINDVTCLKFAPLLQTLAIFECPELGMILSNDDVGSSEDVFGTDIFPFLVNLFLTDLPKMIRICSGVAKFHSLKKLHVDNCSDLRWLPFDANSAQNLEEIIGEKSWWNNLQWASEACHCFFLQKYDSNPRGRTYYLKMELRRVMEKLMVIGVTEIIFEECCSSVNFPLCAAKINILL